MVFWDEKVGINVLLINNNNPRLPPADDQQGAIDQLLGKYEPKIRAIARHIAENGLNPSTVPMVFRTSEGKYIIKDGNRRMTAVKCLMYPEKVKNNPNLKKYFVNLGNKIDRSEFQYIACKVSDDEVEVNLWMEVNHHGEQNGIGQTKWDAMAVSRNRRSIGQPQPNLELFEHLRERLSSPEEEDPMPPIDEDAFDFSTFERIIDNPAFRREIGMKVEGENILFDRPEQEWLRDFKEILLDMTSSKGDENHLDSRTINTAKEIEDYIYKKRNKGFFERPDSPEPSSIHIDANTQPQNKGARGNTRGRPRKVTLIGEDCMINFPKNRMQNLFEELKSLELKKHPDVVSLIFRGLLEMCTKYHYKEIMSIDREPLFQDKLIEIAKDLKKKKLITEDQLKVAKLVADAKEDQSVSIGTEFNQFGHNYDFYPTPESLKRTWESLEPLFKAMFPDDDRIE